MIAGDFNGDGSIDLAVGKTGNSYTGRAYIFYNDGSMPVTTSTADVVIYGPNNQFGGSMIAGDFNTDGKTDLVVGVGNYYTVTNGGAYIFYNDGAYPSTYSGADVTISGEATGDFFGSVLTAGDFNADGRTDLAVSANRYATSIGRVYIFNNDGSYPTTAGAADVIITGEAVNQYFGSSMATGDFNVDGKIDLAVGRSTGKVYIFYSDGANKFGNTACTGFSPALCLAANANVGITGGSWFGQSMAAGDFNSDGKTDLAVGDVAVRIFYNDGSYPTTSGSADVSILNDSIWFTAIVAGDFNGDGRVDLATGDINYNNYTGRVNIFYNDGSYPSNIASADATIAGDIGYGYFGYSMAAGDFNSDGKTDLAAAASVYSVADYNIARVYIYNNDGSYPSTSSAADLTIQTKLVYNQFGWTLASGDFNADGRIDLAVGEPNYYNATGRVNIFYNAGAAPTSANADTIITGEAVNNYFGSALSIGDFNADGKTDLAVGAYGFSTNTGRAYIFKNDGSIPALAANADAIITGEATANYLGNALGSGDFNADGKTDLAVGAYGFSTNTGRAYIFNSARLTSGSQILLPLSTLTNADTVITGEATANNFGSAFVSGDFDYDTKTDLVVGAPGFSTNTGRAYIFYSPRLTSGSQILLPLSTLTNADVNITGETTNNYFGNSFTAADFTNDGKIDLVVDSSGYSNRGRVYLFYNDGAYPPLAVNADWMLTPWSAYFSGFLGIGDINRDGKKDLLIGSSASRKISNDLLVYYNDGVLPTTNAEQNTDMKFSGETATGAFGSAAVFDDFNGDGINDLVIGANGLDAVYYFISKPLRAEGLMRGNFHLRGNARFR